MDTLKSIKQLFLKKKIRKVGPGRVIILTLIVILFASVNIIGTENSITEVSIPQIPKEIGQMMIMQRPSNINLSTRGYDWFDFYDLDSSDKVKVKLSGLNFSHFDTYGQKSFRISSDSGDHSFKSFASEFSFVNNANTEAQQEIATYNVVSKFYPYTPNGKVVRINNDDNQIMYEWSDSFNNSIRENDFITWNQAIKMSIFAREDQERFFSYIWDIDNQTEDHVIEEFIFLMDSIYDSLYKYPTEFEEIPIDLDNYIDYLAISYLFGSGHMDSHNLLFVPEKNNNGYVWNLAPYDLAGLKYFAPNSISRNLNPISQYVFRRPELVVQYQRRVKELSDKIFSNGFISSYYNDINCGKLTEFSGFNELVQMSSRSKVLTVNDLCNLQRRLSSFEKAQPEYVNFELNNSELIWWLREDDLGNQYVYIRIPSKVGVKITEFRCGKKNCLKNADLTNNPYWYKDDWVLLPEYVRSDEQIKSQFVSSDFMYIFKINSTSKISHDDIKIKAKNIITSEDVYPTESIYPTLHITPDEIADNKYKLDVTILWPDIDSVMYNENSTFGHQKQPYELLEKFSFKLEESTCEIDETTGDIILDCSKPKLHTWFYPQYYKINLYFDDILIDTLVNEMYRDAPPKLNKKGKTISRENIDEFKIDKDQFLSNADYQNVVSLLEELSDSKELSEIIEKSENIYILNPNKEYEITNDLNLSENDLLYLKDGTILNIAPLKNLKVGTLLLVGNENKVATIRTRINNLYWNKIESKKGIYAYNSEIVGGVNEDGSIMLEDGEMTIVNSTLNNRTGINCVSCNLTVFNSSFVGKDWLIQGKDSILRIANVEGKNAIKPFIFEDSIGYITGVYLDNLPDLYSHSVFDIRGPASNIKIANTKYENSQTLITKRNYPVIEYDQFNLKENSEKVIELDMQNQYEWIKNMTTEEFEKRYPFFKKDENIPNQYVMKKGKYKITDDIAIPSHITLYIEPGADIEFQKKRGILVYGIIHAVGNELNPIKIDASNNKRWGVILLKDKKAEGYFDYVEFDDGGWKYFTGFTYTGTLSADHAKYMEVKNSLFENSKGDDALNCKYTECKITNNKFINNDFDGIDFDFSSGIIKNNIFIDNGNDAIDLSFDNSLISGNDVKSSGDKCISIGENSKSAIYENKLTNCEIGIEVKDNSKVIAIGNNITNNKIGLNTYQKKRAFGGNGTLYLRDNIIVDNDIEKQNDTWTKIIDNYTDEEVEKLEEVTIPNINDLSDIYTIIDFLPISDLINKDEKLKTIRSIDSGRFNLRIN